MRGLCSLLFAACLLATSMATAAADDGPRQGPVDSTFWSWNPVSLQGKKVDVGKFRGKYLLLDFWGEWCQKCREETPFLLKLRSKYPRLQMLGIYRSDRPALTKQWAEEHRLDWPQVPITAAISDYFRIRKYPTNLLISPDGEIVMDGFSGHSQEFSRRMQWGDSVGIQ
jgi:thiol-disulfide isomerase/thioredoxin